MTKVDSIKYERVVESVDYIRSNLIKNNILFDPTIGIICGSGLSILALAVKKVIPSIKYEDIPNYPYEDQPGHDGELVLGRCDGVDVVIFSGRTHLYQGFSLPETVYPVRLMKLLGVETVILTNVSGALNKGYSVGDFVVVKDHINYAGLAGNNPLVGPNDSRFGPRYFPIVHAYNKELRHEAESVGEALGETVHHGVYAVVGGPNFKSAAEVRMMRVFGADIVGMSTVSEVLTAIHCGLEVLAISLITNVCQDTNDSDDRDDDLVREVFEQVDKKKVCFLELVTGMIARISALNSEKEQ